MEQRVLKTVTVLMLMLTVIVSVSMNFLPELHEKYAASDTVNEKNIQSVKWKKAETVIEEDEQERGQLRIQIPQGVNPGDVQVSDDYLTQTITVTFQGNSQDYFSEYNISGSPEHISSLSSYIQNDSSVLALQMDGVYEIKQETEEDKLYLSFVNPRDIYDKIIVVDAGHGSYMTGATKNGIMEKDLTLQIIHKVQEVFADNPQKIGVYYTRTEDTNPTFKQRADLANILDADLFISLHINSSNTGNFSSLNGVQVMYSQSDDSACSSQQLAQICLEEVCKSTGAKQLKLLEGDEIYIIRSSQVPVALIEAGFMSNREELDKLQQPQYQEKIAEGIYNAVNRAFEEGF